MHNTISVLLMEEGTERSLPRGGPRTELTLEHPAARAEIGRREPLRTSRTRAATGWGPREEFMGKNFEETVVNFQDRRALRA